MPVLIKDDRAVLFIHVPKAGGSSVERLFVRSGWSMTEHQTRKKHRETFRLRRCSPQHWHAALLAELFDLDEFDLVLLVVREPIARFRSEYVMRNRHDPRLDAESVRSWADEQFARYAHDPYIRDNHVRPQSEFWLPQSEVYRLEDGLDTMAATLNDKHDLGLSDQIPRALHSVKRAGVSSRDVAIAPDLEARLREFYAEDFSRFGY